MQAPAHNLGGGGALMLLPVQHDSRHLCLILKNMATAVESTIQTGPDFTALANKV